MPTTERTKAKEKGENRYIKLFEIAFTIKKSSSLSSSLAPVLFGNVSSKLDLPLLSIKNYKLGTERVVRFSNHHITCQAITV